MYNNMFFQIVQTHTRFEGRSTLLTTLICNVYLYINNLPRLHQLCWCCNKDIGLSWFGQSSQSCQFLSASLNTILRVVTIKIKSPCCFQTAEHYNFHFILAFGIAFLIKCYIQNLCRLTMIILILSTFSDVWEWFIDIDGAMQIKQTEVSSEVHLDFLSPADNQSLTIIVLILFPAEGHDRSEGKYIVNGSSSVHCKNIFFIILLSLAWRKLC